MNMTEIREEETDITPVPSIWVRESQELLDKQLGHDWRKKYVVWDCTADHKDLPGDYKFSRLYRSATDSVDPEVFKFDFLNDGAKELMARCPELHEAMTNNEPIVFLFDVPKERGALVNSNTKTKTSMQSFEWGLSSRSLYAQYFYRIYIYKKAFQLKDAHIGVFAPTTYLSAAVFKKFREKFLQAFHYETGFVFDATELDKQKEDWALGFVHFSTKAPTLVHRFSLAAKHITENGVEDIDNTVVYNLDQEITASMWVRAGLRDRERIDLPQFSSVMNVRNNRKQGYVGQMGSVNFDSNSVANNHKDIIIASSTTTRSANVPIMDFNWHKVIPLFAARRSVKRNWLNWQQEYRIPDQEHPIWAQYQADSLVFSMFDTKSNQVSLGNVLYNDRVYDIRNEFFWIDPSKLLKMFTNRGFDDFYRDYVECETPYFLNILQNSPLSDDAQALLDSATHLMEISVDSRIEMHANHPEWHLHRWDAGYAQMKKVWMKHHMKEYKEFRAQFEKFRDNMAARTYLLGFLG